MCLVRVVRKCCLVPGGTQLVVGERKRPVGWGGGMGRWQERKRPRVGQRAPVGSCLGLVLGGH